jgi:Putative prokaryotic signal transducing protein
MRELLITNDPVLLSYVEALLADQGVDAVVFDRHISVLEGGISAFPRRLLVGDRDWRRAADILTDAGLGQWIAADHGT